MLVLDESGSITESGFGKMLDFSEDLVNELNIGSTEAMIACLSFAYASRVHFDFHSHSSKWDVINAIQNIAYKSGGTSTADGLRTAKARYTTSYGRRTDALSLAIVLTDGDSYDRQDTLNEASNLLSHVVAVYCIGVGTYSDDTELKAIASNPNDDYLIQTSDFDDLKNKVTGLVSSLCIGRLY